MDGLTIRAAVPSDGLELRRAVIELQDHESRLHPSRVKSDHIADVYLDWMQKRAAEHGAVLIAELDGAMAGLDIVMTASAASEAPPIDGVGKFATFDRPSLTIAFNVTGCPAMSVCCGYSDKGLPLSFQIVGKRFKDATVLRLAHAYEQTTPWRSRRPVL